MEDQELGQNQTPVEPQASYSILAIPGQKLTQQYKPIVVKRWSRSLRQYNDYFRIVDRSAYYSVYDNYIASILSRPDTIVRLAALTDDTDVVLGFSVVEGISLHYCHVQEDARRKGIGSSLVPNKIEYITHVTRAGLKIWNNKYPHWKFNPFI